MTHTLTDLFCGAGVTPPAAAWFVRAVAASLDTSTTGTGPTSARGAV